LSTPGYTNGQFSQYNLCHYFFLTCLYFDIRLKILNSSFLSIDVYFVRRSEIVDTLQLMGEFQIDNKIKTDFAFFFYVVLENLEFPCE